MCICKLNKRSVSWGVSQPLSSPNSGNKEITWMMLEAGAETDLVNSVGRTAAQMAAFVGKLKRVSNLLGANGIMRWYNLMARGTPLCFLWTFIFFTLKLIFCFNWFFWSLLVASHQRARFYCVATDIIIFMKAHPTEKCKYIAPVLEVWKLYWLVSCHPLKQIGYYLDVRSKAMYFILKGVYTNAVLILKE